MQNKNLILIVDDEEVGREALEVLLSGEDYELVFAADGPEAYKKAVEVNPDLILLDIRMPGLDGYQVCRKLRKHPRLSEVPVIMVTSLDDQESRLEGIEAGADDFISKPYNIMELKTRVKTITKLNRYRRLHEERENFRWVVEQSDDGYLIINSKEEIIYANPRARDYLGISEEIEGRGECFITVAGKQYSLEPQTAWFAWPEKALKSPLYLLRPETENSPVFWLQVEALKMLAGSGNYLVRLRNVTEEIVSRSNVWTFHDLVAHKFSTPLTRLEFIFNFLKKDRSLLSEGDIEKFIREGYSATLSIKKQILTVLNSITSSEVLKSGQGTINIKEIFDIIERLCEDLNIGKIENSFENISKPEETYIRFSLPAIEIILREIFINAIKFHPSNDPEIKVRFLLFNEKLRLQIFDNGLSLSPEQLINMWIPYHQAEKYFTGQVPGMGLGLSTIASVIWSSGGKCKSYNRPDGPGIVIELLLPMKIN